MKNVLTFRRFCVAALLLAALVSAPSAAWAAFGLTTDPTYYTVDTGAGLVFKIRRVDFGSNTQSPGDIAGLVYNGVEYQDQTRGSQVNSGFDYLYTGVSAVTVDAAVVNTNFIKITVTAGDLTHYYIARNGDPCIYMGTYFVTEPSTLGLCRYIVRIPSTMLPNGPAPSDIRGTTSTVEASDIFALPLAAGQTRPETRSKHYSNQRLIDWSYIGATGPNVGVWMVRDNNEGNSGGPFYRCLLNQGSADQEITYIVNYGEGQTEAFRPGILNCYILVFTHGAPPSLPLDTSWFSAMGLTGYVPPSGRGSVTGSGITGRDTKFAYTVGFSNSAAQYWASASPADGSFTCPNMRPGVYAMTVYKNELGVYTGSVTVTAGGVTSVDAIAVGGGDPGSVTPLWRIGDWDGSPQEFLNGDKVTYMHPSDVRISAWNPGTYVVGTSSPAAGFPCYQWKDVNGTETVQFNLTAAQIAARTARVGITTAFSGARPIITVNAWKSSNPHPSTQPASRTLTVGTYRGNNTTFAFNVPAGAFVVGTNTMTIVPISGITGTGFLSPGYSVDAVDMTPTLTTLGGTITLQASATMAQPLTCTLTPTGTTTGSVTTQTLTPAPDGTFTLSNVPAGTYMLGIKGSKWLRKDVAVDTTGGSVSGLSVTLLGGDADGNNKINATDYLMLRKAYNTSVGDPNYEPRADFDCNGKINATDYLILRQNYNKVGDP